MYGACVINTIITDKSTMEKILTSYFDYFIFVLNISSCSAIQLKSSTCVEFQPLKFHQLERRKLLRSRIDGIKRRSFYIFILKNNWTSSFKKILFAINEFNFVPCNMPKRKRFLKEHNTLRFWKLKLSILQNVS